MGSEMCIRDRTRTAGAGGERWSGSFRLKALVTRGGRYVDTCRARVRFTLRPA